MLRRAILAALPVATLLPKWAQASDFNSFLAALQARAARDGIPESIIQSTTGGLVPNADVLQLDKHQPEFTLTWAQYSSRVLNAGRIQQGRVTAQTSASVLGAVTSQYGVDAGPLLGIWGIETNYGTTQGDFDVIDALTTLAWDRNSSFFGGQVISAMRIIANGDAPAEKLIGSYAGAMGQPQFMPSVYLSTAVAYLRFRPAGYLVQRCRYLGVDGELSGARRLAGRDSLQASRCWRLPASMCRQTGRELVRTIGYWESLGVQRLPGARVICRQTTPAALIAARWRRGAGIFWFTAISR